MFTIQFFEAIIQLLHINSDSIYKGIRRIVNYSGTIKKAKELDSHTRKVILEKILDNTSQIVREGEIHLLYPRTANHIDVVKVNQSGKYINSYSICINHRLDRNNVYLIS